MFRFFIFNVFFFTQTIIFAANAVSSSDLSFADKQIDPVVQRLTDRTTLLTTVVGAFSVGLAEPQDDQVRSEWKHYQKMDKNSAHIGDLMGTGGIAAVSSLAQYYLDDREYVYQSHLRGLVYGGIAIYTLKTAFARPRPGNSDNHQSFPSGHSSIAFMSATHLTYAYGWKAAVIAYPVASFVAASRLSEDVHWYSDTIAGAFLGFIIGRATFYDPYESSSTDKKSNIQWDLIPIISQKQQSLVLNVLF